jgi:alkylation response protein AidB-like acyl-CoA dehydrogenase
MDFSLSEAQTIFRDSVARFVADEYPFATRQRIVAEEPGYREAHWRRFAELGWLAASLPEQHGGLGGSAVETMLLMEQFGRGLVMTPYLTTVVLSGNAVLLGGSERQRAALLPAIGQGRLKLSLAFAEPQSRYDLFDVRTRARKRGGGYVLEGHKSVVLYAETADKLIVSARTAGGVRDAGGISLFLIERNAPGVELRGYPTQDGGRASEVRLAGVRAAAEDLLGPAGEALPILERVVDHAIAAVCAEAVGAMWSVYEQTLAYHKTREQFGQKLGSFQALQHRLVDVYMKCQLAQSMVYEATLNLDDPDPRARARAVSSAKFEIGKYARDVGQEGVQLHGGIGMTWDVAVGHHLKRITLIGASFGDSSYHLRRYRSLMPAD